MYGDRPSRRGERVRKPLRGAPRLCRSRTGTVRARKPASAAVHTSTSYELLTLSPIPLLNNNPKSFRQPLLPQECPLFARARLSSACLPTLYVRFAFHSTTVILSRLFRQISSECCLLMLVCCIRSTARTPGKPKYPGLFLYSK